MVHVALTGSRGQRFVAALPETRRERTRGLLGRERLAPGEALLLEWTRSVHTVGMRMAITVALLDRDLRVVAVRRLEPGRLVLPRRSVRHVLECAPDTDVRPGDEFRPADERSSSALRTGLRRRQTPACPPFDR